MDTVRICMRHSFSRVGSGHFLGRIFLMGVLTMNAFAVELENLDSTGPGALPPGWTAGATGKGSPRWAVVPDASAPSGPNVLEQSGTATFPWCVKPSASFENGFVEVRFNPASGKEDQAGGVWAKADSVTRFDDFRYGPATAP